MKNNNAKLLALAEAIKGLNSDQTASQLRRVEQTSVEKSQYLRQEGVMVSGVFEKGKSCFVPIGSSTFFDKGLANINGIGMKNGTHVPAAMLRYINQYDNKFYVPHMSSLKPGEEHYEYAGPLDPNQCIERGTTIARAYGLREDQIEALKNAFLGLDRAHKVYKYYRVKGETSVANTEIPNIDEYSDFF